MSGQMRSDLSERLQDLVRTRAKDVLEGLDELWKVEVKEALEDLAQLTLLKLTDQKNLVVDREILHCEARIKNWTFVGVDQVRDAIKDAIKEILEVLGSVLKGFLK